jgi:hypothetical protein
MTWLDQPAEGLDAGRRLAAAQQAGLVHVPGGQVGECAAALVLVLDLHHARHAWWQRGMAAAAGLDAGLLIGRDDELVWLQAPALEAALVQVERHAGLGGEVGSAREDP